MSKRILLDFPLRDCFDLLVLNIFHLHPLFSGIYISYHHPPHHYPAKKKALFWETEEEINEIGLHALVNSYNERITWKQFSLRLAKPFFSLYSPLSSYSIGILLRMEQSPKNQLHPQSKWLATLSVAGESEEEVTKPEDLIRLFIMWQEALKCSYCCSYESSCHPNGDKGLL